MGNRERLACDDPNEMWMLFAGRSERKSRLLVVALCRQLWNVFRDEACQIAVEVAERFADELANEDKLDKARMDAVHCVGTISCVSGVMHELHLEIADATRWTGRMGRAQLLAADAAVHASGMTHNLHDGYEIALDALKMAGVEQSPQRVLALFHEIFGCRLLHSGTVDPMWLTSDVLALGRGIYDEKAFDRMPILADALQDAGCDNDDILNHLRDATAPHVRGCWALDLVLGKE